MNAWSPQIATDLQVSFAKQDLPGPSRQSASTLCKGNDHPSFKVEYMIPKGVLQRRHCVLQLLNAKQQVRWAEVDIVRPLSAHCQAYDNHWLLTCSLNKMVELLHTRQTRQVPLGHSILDPTAPNFEWSRAHRCHSAALPHTYPPLVPPAGKSQTQECFDARERCRNQDNLHRWLGSHACAVEFVQ